MIRDIDDLEDAPEFGTALLALEETNVVIVLGKLVDLTTMQYDGKSLAFLARPGMGAVIASRTMLVNSLAELDAYDGRLGLAPPYSDKALRHFTKEPDDSEE